MEEIIVNLKGRTEYFTLADTIENSSWQGDYEKQVIVFAPSVMDEFKEEYRNPENQLFYAFGGFGTKTYTIGNAVMGRFLSDGEECRRNRGDFIGILKPELVEEYEINVEAVKSGN